MVFWPWRDWKKFLKWLFIFSTGYSKPVDIWAIGAILGELSDGQPLFPGDSDIDQLYQIQSMLGSLPHSQIEHLSKNPKFNGYKVCRNS